MRAGVLLAGSMMNLLLAPVLFSAALMVGEPVPCGACATVQVYGVVPGEPADLADVRENDVIVSMGSEDVRSVEDVQRLAQLWAGQEVVLHVRRGGELTALRLTPRHVTRERVGALGVQLGPVYVIARRPVWEAVPRGVRRVGELLVTLPVELGRFVRGDAGAELSGPVGIARSTGSAAKAGPNYLLAFSAFLSLNLAVVNMLPLPGLDGGRLIFVLIEAVRRGRRINPRFEGMVHLGGMVLLLALMAVVSVHDVRGILAG